MTDKNKSQTYSLITEDKCIEYIKKQPNTTFKEKNRHGGTTFKFSEINDANDESSEAEDDIYYDAVESNDINDISWKKLIRELQQQAMTIQELEKENQESKQSEINSKKTHIML